MSKYQMSRHSPVAPVLLLPTSPVSPVVGASAPVLPPLDSPPVPVVLPVDGSPPEELLPGPLLDVRATSEVMLAPSSLKQAAGIVVNRASAADRGHRPYGAWMDGSGR